MYCDRKACILTLKALNWAFSLLVIFTVGVAAGLLAAVVAAAVVVVVCDGWVVVVVVVVEVLGTAAAA